MSEQGQAPGNAKAQALVAQMRATRDEVVGELSALSEADCQYPAPWGGVTRKVNFMLRAFSLHELDHLQHVQRLLRGRGRHLSEAQLLLVKAQALRGELEAMILGLSDEELDATGPGEDWSVRQVVEHVVSTDRKYLSDTLGAVQAGRAGA